MFKKWSKENHFRIIRFSTSVLDFVKHAFNWVKLPNKEQWLNLTRYPYWIFQTIGCLDKVFASIVYYLLHSSLQAETLIWEYDVCRKERSPTVNSKEVSTMEILDQSRGNSDARPGCFTWNSDRHWMSQITSWNEIVQGAIWSTRRQASVVFRNFNSFESCILHYANFSLLTGLFRLHLIITA